MDEGSNRFVLGRGAGVEWDAQRVLALPLGHFTLRESMVLGAHGELAHNTYVFNPQDATQEPASRPLCMGGALAWMHWTLQTCWQHGRHTRTPTE